MKQGYEKPVIYFETFKLDTAICSCGTGANAGLAGRPHHGDPHACYYGEGGAGNFCEDGTACVNDPLIEPIPHDLVVDAYCYHGPSPDVSVFAS